MPHLASHGAETDDLGLTPADRDPARWRCGDYVHNLATGVTWLVAYVDGARVGWFGYPLREVAAEDCIRIKTCSDAEHVELLRRLARTADDKRGDRARATLKRMGQTNA